MRNLPLRRVWYAVAPIVLSAVVCLAAKQLVMPKANPAKSYPAHDEHPEEKVTVAVDPYDTPDKSSIFSLKYNDAGLLPVFVVITNDGDSPVALTSVDAKFVTADGSKLSPAGTDEINRRFSRPRAAATTPRPWPTRKVKGGISQQAQDEMQGAQFAAHAVEPHSTQSGFMFFDVQDISAPLAGAHFYLTGVRDAKGSELLYFEVPLDKYLAASPKSN